jgi:hypothetical protein
MRSATTAVQRRGVTPYEAGSSASGALLALSWLLSLCSCFRVPLPRSCVVRLFASNDRATRVQLLHHLPAFIDKLGADIINGHILTQVGGGG